MSNFKTVVKHHRATNLLHFEDNVRKKLFSSLLPQIKNPSPLKVSILYYNIHSLQVSKSYVFESGEDIDGLVQFLNSNEFDDQINRIESYKEI